MRRILTLGLLVAATTTSALAGEQVGIPACDDFLNKYEACIGAKVPEAQQTTFRSQLDLTRKSWAEMAKDASAKPILENTCKQTFEHVKTALQPYGCPF